MAAERLSNGGVGAGSMNRDGELGIRRFGEKVAHENGITGSSRAGEHGSEVAIRQGKFGNSGVKGGGREGRAVRGRVLGQRD